MKPQIINSNELVLNEGIDLNTAYGLIDLSTNSPATKDKYKKNVVHFVNYIQEFGLNRKSLLLFRVHLDQPIIKKDGKSLVSDRTKNGYLAAATNLVKQGIKHDVISDNINTEVEGFKLIKQHKEGLTLMEVVGVLNIIKGIEKEEKRLKLKAMFSLLAFRGLRQMELQGIRIEHVNFTDNTIRFRRKGQRQQFTLDTNGEKIEDFSKYEAHKCFPLVMSALKAYISFLGVNEGYLFAGLTTKNGKRIRDYNKPLSLVAIRKIFTETEEGKTDGLFKLAGIPKEKSLHGTRHFFGTYLISKGYSPAEVARLLGHKTLDMVMTYLDNSNMGALMEKLEQDFNF